MMVLVAEDDRVSRRLISTGLECLGYQPVTAVDGQEALDVLGASAPPQLVILDWKMPRLDGLETCRRIRARRGAPYTYVAMLTSNGSRTDLLAGLEAGADDYLVKPVHLDELGSRLRAGERIVRHQSDLVTERDGLREQAHHDALTGALNRAAVIPLLEDLAAGDRALSVVFCDVDHFKAVNDLHGHPVGDAVLREITRRLAAHIRPGDALCRYGGEEFLVVLPDCAPEDAAVLAERLRLDVCATPLGTHRAELAVSCSFGVAGRRSGNEATAASLIADADRALYRAKRGGRNRVETVDATAPRTSAPPVSSHRTLPPGGGGHPGALRFERDSVPAAPASR